MSEVYFSNSNLLIRSMEVDDAKIIYDTYLSYGCKRQILRLG